MCGIAGIVDLGGRPVAADELSRLTDLLSHRGPDGAGAWFSEDRTVGLGHRRLAIIDVSDRGSQPMLSSDDRYTIVFNGEIYNFLELRRELESAGVAFRSDSDTEVILAAWSAWGEAMLQKFNGMWALAIYDTRTRELFLARDRFGVKPLLYARSGTRFLFSSEQRALVRSGLVGGAVHEDVARRLMVDPFGVEASTHTLWREVSRLQAGHCMRVRGRRLEIKRWWCTVDHLPDIPRTEQERIAQFRELFMDSVALRMRSDVPIGTCLSGGFDSSAVACTMAAHEKGGLGPRDSVSWRHAFVATFPGSSNDERPMAEEAARWAGISPIMLEIDNGDALQEIDRIIDDNDDVYISLPSAVWLIYRELRRHSVTVSLDGHGADELMGAYLQQGQSTAFKIRNAVTAAMLHSRLARRAADLSRAAVLARQGEYFLRGGLRALPSPFDLTAEGDKLPSSWGALNRRLYRMFHSTVLPTILRNFDRLSMAHGIEVRMPFMDWRLVTYTMALPDESKWSQGYTKMVARQAMAGAMPEAIRMGRRKVGFNSPMPEWLNGPLRPWMMSLLDKKVPLFSELVDEGPLRTAVDLHTNRQSWSWESAGHIWPYLNMKCALAKAT